jgi:transposase
VRATLFVVGKRSAEVVREVLDNWDTFWVALDHADLPLSNDEAERALRHWVIARRTRMGIGTDEGTRTFANLTCVIETCRKPSLSP